MHEVDELDSRSKKILWSIIQSYIDTNGPVGSRTVMKKYSLQWSSATIRNTMADLEEMGYVTQPHTSAGRIPTERGYRFYVNTLLRENTFTISKRALHQLAIRLRRIEKDITTLIKEASKTLSSFSNYLGVVTAPNEEEIILEYIEFIKHNNYRILCILISKEGVIKNKFLSLENNLFTQQQLEKISKYLNTEFSGLTLKEIRNNILSKMSIEKNICDRLIRNALALCEKALKIDDEVPYTGEISGAGNLVEFATMKQIKDLFKAIEEKHLMVKLLDKISNAEGVQVFIGSENTMDEMKDMSFVASTYNDGRHSLGTIGVIGPTSMNYSKVIPIVSHTANTLTQIFSEMRSA
jgi:heat-inducible transcriptional repressor